MEWTYDLLLTQKIAKVLGYNFQDQVFKSMWYLSSMPSCCLLTHSLWERLLFCGENLLPWVPLSKSQGASLEEFLSKLNLAINASLPNHLTAAWWATYARNVGRILHYNSWPDILNFRCFRPSSLRVLCYTAADKSMQMPTICLASSILLVV